MLAILAKACDADLHSLLLTTLFFAPIAVTPPPRLLLLLLLLLQSGAINQSTAFPLLAGIETRRQADRMSSRVFRVTQDTNGYPCLPFYHFAITLVSFFSSVFSFSPLSRISVTSCPNGEADSCRYTRAKVAARVCCMYYAGTEHHIRGIDHQVHTRRRSGMTFTHFREKRFETRSMTIRIRGCVWINIYIIYVNMYGADHIL